MGAKSNKIKFTQTETFLSCLKIKPSVDTSGTVTVVDHDVMVRNGKVWFNTKSRQNQRVAFGT